ncbi:MAG TPA: AraC family transcriptional regulator ligand-binding domain-containing protein [Phenylobacterium sp.]
MTESPALEQLPMTSGYFRLILRRFGDTPERRAAILDGTGLTDEMLRDSSVDITLFQQVRQVENVVNLLGDGWVLRAPELWDAPAHGPLSVAATSAPDIASMIDVITRFGFVRAPFYRSSLRRGPSWSQIEYELTVPIEERLWRPMIEIGFIGVRSALTIALAASPLGASFLFACPEPAHSRKVRAILGEGVVYGAPVNAVRFPSAWLALETPFADATLHALGLGELQAALGRITTPGGLRGRVERLLSSIPSGRITSDDAARLTGVSRRTLVRRLAESGVGYRQLVDAELRTRAERFLREGVLSHARIAEELGYTDATSFSRACRRWFKGPVRPG